MRPVDYSGQNGGRGEVGGRRGRKGKQETTILISPWVRMVKSQTRMIAKKAEPGKLRPQGAVPLVAALALSESGRVEDPLGGGRAVQTPSAWLVGLKLVEPWERPVGRWEATGIVAMQPGWGEMGASLGTECERVCVT